MQALVHNILGGAEVLTRWPGLYCLPGSYVEELIAGKCSRKVTFLLAPPSALL